ncbi:MAG: TIR domain-containing protein [Cyanobacteria bacterium J06555_13]
MPSLQRHEVIQVFFSYSHSDEKLRNELAKHLGLLKRKGVIDTWHDRDIEAGTEWRQAIDKHLQSAQIILLLVSSDFLNSDYCYELEMEMAMDRHAKGEACVIPVILRPVDWTEAPFSKLKSLPNDGKPVTSWENQDEAFRDVAYGLRKVVEKLTTKTTDRPKKKNLILNKDKPENRAVILGHDNSATNSNEWHVDAERPGRANSRPQSSVEQLSSAERLTLIQTLNALPLDAFDNLVYGLAPPEGTLPVEEISQRNRCLALLEWAESSKGPGLREVEGLLIGTVSAQAGIDKTFKVVVISGNISRETVAEMEAYVQFLRQRTGEGSIGIVLYEEGSIRLILSGSSAGLEKMQGLFDLGDLAFVDMTLVENVQPVDNHTTSARTARLVEVLKLRGHSLLLEPLLARARDIFRDIARARTSASARDIVSARDIARARARARDIFSDLDLFRDIDLARALDFARDLARALGLFRSGISRWHIASVNDLTGEIDVASDLTSDIDLTSASDLDLDLALVLASDLARALASDLARTLDSAGALDFARSRARALARAHNHSPAPDLDLTDADLRSTNLRNINLLGVNLTRADLTGADVQGTVFGDNEGLLESVKSDLQKRGAIFQDSPGSNVPSWVRV